ncbi:Phosphatidylinositol transfer protein sfh5 [Neonectria ditissima]|uniref:Phosphatidylinositol transfer protein SFH5 n=1 Tax=Neonectria ditissima TaxID=78410 RepID=A0A0N8H5B0_9HYPO|nr:Phosphatidylinositol transfer protein sfh5 [Neonectria ditissima]
MATEQDKTVTAVPAETIAAPAVAAADKPVDQQPVEQSAEQPGEKAAEAVAPLTPPVETPVVKLNARLADIVSQTGYSEMWGVQLSDIDHVPTKVVLQKFLRANNDDVAAAEKQLVSALEWRKKMQPASLVNKTFDKKKFNDLGFVTVHKAEDGKETIITWNIYGAVKDNKATFGNVEEFIKWRAAIMELSVQKLNLAAVTEAIPEGGEDPYQMIQVHDYLSVSFFRMDPAVKAASKETISVFSMAYPELLSNKYFVNVPAIMGWMFGAMKLFLSPATLRKFHPMTSGTTLATELKSIVSSLPKEYGGQGSSVKEGLTISLAEAKEKPEDKPKEVAAAEKAAETPVEETKPIETKPAVEETTLVDRTKPAEEVKPAEEPKSTEEVKAVEETKPATEEVKSA